MCSTLAILQKYMPCSVTGNDLMQLPDQMLAGHAALHATTLMKEASSSHRSESG